MANIERDKLIGKVRRLVKHRELMMKEFGARKTTDRLTAVTKINRNLEFIKAKSLPVVASCIKRLHNDILLIMPGRSSKFYESDFRTLSEIMEECDSYVSVKS